MLIDGDFWKLIKHCVNGARPLVKVLQLIDNDLKPDITVYEAMGWAKKQTQNNSNKKKSMYKRAWDIIDAASCFCTDLHMQLVIFSIQSKIIF